MTDPIANMRERAAQHRRLADLTHDTAVRDQLRRWAVEIEIDARKLEAERKGS